MATLLNRKIGYLTLVDKTIREAQIDDLAISDVKVKDATLSFPKTNADFAGKLLDTVKRAVYPIISGAALDLPAASVMDVTSHFAGVAASTAAPTYDATTRTWTNLGAVVDPADNKVRLRKPGASNTEGTDPIVDANGDEVYARLVYTPAVGGATPSPEKWEIKFYTAPGGVEAAHTLSAITKAFAVHKQWVPGSSTMLEDQGKTIVTAPGSVDITETNNINQLAKDLGITLSGTGAMSLAKSVINRIADHVAGLAERHSSNELDAHADVNINGFTDGGTLTAALNQLQANITATGTAALDDLRIYFNELRSNGILGTAAVLSDAVAGDLVVNVAALTAYVAGKRFAVAAQTVTVPASATTYLWVDNAGAVQQGAAYPADLDTIAKLGKVVSNTTAVTSLADEHRALVELDQKVLDVEALINAHVASTSAHDAADIVFDNTNSGLKNADDTAVANAQQAIDALQRRLGAVKREDEIFELTQAQIDGATTDGALKYILLTLSNGKSYEVGKGKMECIIDGDDQDLGRVFTESSTTTVRVYFDPAEPLVAGQRVKLRWLSV